MDRTKYQYEGMKWLMEQELLNQPQAINTIKLNILMVSPRIKEVELLIYRENASMLVLLELTWTGRKFFKKRIFSEVEDILVQLLPSFRFRVTENPEIMKLAIEKVKQALSGGKNENVSNPSSTSVQRSDQSSIISASSQENARSEEGTESNQKEQPKALEGVLENSSPDDHREE